MLLFDEKGFLVPYQAIPADLETMRGKFVFNERRSQIFQQYLELLEALRAILPTNTPILQWIDGSFVTKTAYPSDLDIVIFLGESVYRKHRASLESTLLRFTKTDAYFVSVLPTDHPQRFVYDYNLMYWRDVFGHTREGEEKGFIQLHENHGIA